MKKHKLIFLILFILFSIFSFAQSESFSVMTWNIWHGGLHGSKTNNFEKDSLNTINVLKVLEEVNPDIVLMQETYCCGMEIAKQAGYKYSERGSSNLSIHSNYPILETIDVFKPFNSHAAIIDIHGQKTLCVNIWLHYLPDYFVDVKTMSIDSLIQQESPTRLKEIINILHELDSLEKHYQLPIIIGGDFNSGSHFDWIESTKEWHYDKVIEWPVSKEMVNSEYLDSFRIHHPDPTNSLQGTWGYLNDDLMSDRIDYIYFKSNKLKVIDSQIIMDDPQNGFFNSDHRAIYTEFEWIKP